jgi:CubicO group peptidase (beta-lactamase class C family)
MTHRLNLTIVLTVLPVFFVRAQINSNEPLFTELKKQDSIFFERGFNQCDLDYLGDHITEDIKFYHDQAGFQDRNTFLENMRKNICSNSGQKPIRKVDENSFQVFPLYSNGKLYGAIQSGTHQFYLRSEQGEVWTGMARFTHTWLLENGIWKLSVVLSYDHRDTIPSHQDDAMEHLLKENNVPALGLGIIENGRLTRVQVYGTLDKLVTAPYNTIFKVASLTKPIVTMTVLRLIDKGLLGLDEPLYKYWIDPDIQQDERYKLLTPRIVLTHQTGFPNWRYQTEKNKLAFQFDPGTQHQYSGEGFEYLRKALEIKFGKPMEEMTKEMLFTPLEMTDTHFWWDTTMDESRYARNFNDRGEMIPTDKYYQANAAANLLTTVQDYGRFLAFVINGAGLSKKLFQEMVKHQVTLKENDFFGLGWEILTGFSHDEYALIHTGKDPGVSTMAILFPVSGNGYVIFLNGDNATPVFEELLTKQLYLGKELWNKR